MISKIYVSDFQSHRRTELNLHPCFNIIVGQSGSGKSAFLRALNAMFYNNMQGTSFIRIDPKNKPDSYMIGITPAGSGKRIIKTRAKDVNKYEIIEHGEVGGVQLFVSEGSNNIKKFENVKTDVPKEVTDVLKIHPVKIDANKEINIQYCGQFDAPFMLMEPDAAKMKFLNTVSGTAAVDLAIKEANLRYQRAKKSREASELSIAKLELEKTEFDTKVSTLETANKYLTTRNDEYKALVKEGEKLKALQIQSDQLVAKFKQVKALDSLLSKVVFTEILEKVAKLQKFLDLREKYTEILSKYRSLQKAEKRFAQFDVDKLISSIDRYVQLHSMQMKYKDLADRYNALRPMLTPLNRTINKELFRALDKAETYLSLQGFYDKLLAAVQENGRKLSDNQKNLDKDIQNYIELLSELKMCPVCNGPITGSVLEHIRKEL